MLKTLTITLALFFFVSNASAQTVEEDTKSIDAIMTAVYDVISGPAGEQRDWDRFRSLFAPGAKLIPVVLSQGATPIAGYNSIDDYIGFVDQYFLENGFFEVEIFRKVERFGHVAHAFSTYESRQKEDDAEPFARGINSFQLLHDGNRWWVVNIFWNDENAAGETIPDKYLSDQK